MLQRFPKSSGNALTGSTSNTTLPDEKGGVLYLQAAPTNAGNVTIRVPTSTGYSSAVMVLTPGSFAPPIGPIDSLAQYAYQLGNASDSLYYSVIR